jgi:hypothetical protein
VQGHLGCLGRLLLLVVMSRTVSPTRAFMPALHAQHGHRGPRLPLGVRRARATSISERPDKARAKTQTIGQYQQKSLIARHEIPFQ